MRRLKSAKSEKNKKFYRLLSPTLIDFTPPRHFAISTKNRRFTGNTEGQLFFLRAATVMERAVNKIENRKPKMKNQKSPGVSRTDQNCVYAQTLASSNPHNFEPLSSRRLRRFPLCAPGVLCGKKFVSIRVHSWF